VVFFVFTFITSAARHRLSNRN